MAVPSSSPVTVQSIALALPEHTLTNQEAEARLREVFVAQGEDPSLIQQVFQNTGIDRRYLARPPAFYLSEHGLTARNHGAYEEVARELGIAASRDALAQAGVRPDQVDLVIDTSCTGVMIPALDVYVANELGMRPDVRRMPLTEAGCAAGATALAFASEYLTARPQANVLIVSVELPSLTLQLTDGSRANLISSAIFGDGAAALVVNRAAPRGVAIEHLAHEALLIPGTPDVMGFDLRDEGFKIILSRRIPFLVRDQLRPAVDAFLERQGLTLAQIGFFVLHPGGTKVLDNVRDSLGLREEDVGASRRVLRDYGNLSSASVHAVARRLLDEGAVVPGTFGLLCAMGPGFTIELALLRGRAG